MTVSPAALTVVDDPPPRRIRNSLDGIRLVGVAGLLLILGAFASVFSDTTLGANEDLKRAVGHLPPLLVDAVTVVGGIGALSVPVAVIVRAVARGQRRRLADALFAGLVTAAVVVLIDLAVDSAPHTALYRALVVTSASSATEPMDIYLAVWLCLTTVLGIAAERVWAALAGWAAAVYALSTFIAADASLLSVVASVFVGIAVGVAMRFVAGAVNERPDAPAIATALAARGIPVCEIERVPGPRPLHRLYRATGEDGRRLFIDMLDRDESGYGWFYRVYRSLRVQPEVAGGAELSIERTAERRSLLAYTAAATGARVPTFHGAVVCGTEAIALVYSHHDTTPLDGLEGPPSSRQLRDVWRSLERLHDARVSLPALTTASIGVDRDGEILLPILDSGTAFAGDLRMSVDRAQLLTVTAQLVGADEAVRIARDELGDALLASTVPVLQPVALGRDTRHWLAKHTALLDEIRSEIEGQTHAAPPMAFRLDRVRPRTVFTLGALIVAGWLLIGQVGSLRLGSVLRAADWRWVPLLLVASAATYLAAALSMVGYVRERLSFAHTVEVQLAASFTGFVTPPAVGGFAINLRFLRKSGLSTPVAVTSVGVSQLVNAVLHVVLLLAVAAATGTQTGHRLPVPSWAFLALGILVALVLLVLAVPAPRRWLLGRVLPPLREALPRLLDLVTNPVKLTEAIGGALLLNVCYIAALFFATRAFNGNVDVVSVAVVYLAGGAIGSLAPTPGGLGAVEAALSTGLVAAGMPGAAAVSAVLLFRLATFWLPVPIGWGAMHLLQRQAAI